jgi:uncharacterized protein
LLFSLWMPPTDRSAPGVRLALFKNEKATVGESLDLGGRLLSFAFEDCEEKADKLTLELDNHDLALFDREELMGGAILEVSWGYPGQMSPPRRVVLKSMKGFLSLKVEGQALSALMNQQQKTRRWEKKSRADVVREVARENGYEGAFADLDDTKETLDVINQAAETDARLLKRLAVREGFAFFVDGSGLHWHRRRQQTPPTHTFTWLNDERGEVLSVSVESELARRVGSSTVKGRDPLSKTTVESSSSADTAKRSTLGDTIEVVDPKSGVTSLQKRNATATVATSAAGAKGKIAREADARFVKAERETIKLAVQVVGDPTLAAKTVVEVRGISGLLSGKYYVTEAKHAIGSGGYTVDLKLKRDAKGKGSGQGDAKPQTGDKNTAKTPPAGAKKEVEAIDPETGKSRVEYRDDPGRTGSSDPEAKPPRKER